MRISGELAFPEKTSIRDGRKLSRRFEVALETAFFKEPIAAQASRGSQEPRGSTVIGRQGIILKPSGTVDLPFAPTLDSGLGFG
jgi:hypothetical protein